MTLEIQISEQMSQLLADQVRKGEFNSPEDLATARVRFGSEKSRLILRIFERLGRLIRASRCGMRRERAGYAPIALIHQTSRLIVFLQFVL